MKTQENMKHMNECKKKEYETPIVKVIEFETGHMLAQSNLPFGNPGPFD